MLAVPLDRLIIAALLAVYALSFQVDSLINARVEVLSQDSWHMIDAVADNKPYPFSPQHHILVHVLVDAAAALTPPLADETRVSAYRLLKILTLAIALSFWLVVRRLLERLGLGDGERALLLSFFGLSTSDWFHFAAPETHALAFPALAAYLLAIVTLSEGRGSTRLARGLLIGSIVVAGLARIDQWRLLPLTALLAMLPALRRVRRQILRDVAIATLIGGVASIVAVHAYVGGPWSDAPEKLLQRTDTRNLARRVGHLANLDGVKLARMARSISTYSLVMPLPVAGQPDASRFRAFWSPVAAFLARPASLAVLAGTLALMLFSAFVAGGAGIRGDPLAIAIALYTGSGWLFYTWLNPWEPFLWLGEFLPFQIALTACALRGRGRPHWIALGVLTLALAAHNGAYFWYALR